MRTGESTGSLAGHGDGAKLHIRPDAYPAPVDGGYGILTEQGMVRFSGTSIGPWLEWLLPRLDGTCSLDELVAALPPAHAARARHIVEVLGERGILQPSAYPGGGGAERPDWQRLGSLLVIGSGVMVEALACAGLRAGWPSDQMTVRQLESTSGELLVDHLSGADAVLHAADMQAGWRAELVDRWCTARGVLVAHTITAADGIWLVPAGEPVAPGVWTAVRGRMLDAGVSVGTVRGSPSGPAGSAGGAPPAVAVAAAGQLVHGLQHTLSGRPAALPDNRLVRLDRVTLQTHVHKFLPHPDAFDVVADSRSDFAERIARLRAGDRLTEAGFSRKAAGGVDERLGILALPEHGWAQAPLYVSESRVTATGSPDGRARPLSSIGAGFNLQTARCRAALAALALYAGTVIDHRRLLDPNGEPYYAEPGGLPGSGLAARQHDSGRAAIWSYELTAPGAARLVPLANAFPLLARSRPRKPAAAPLEADGSRLDLPPGRGAGYDWDEAVETGLMSHCLRLTVAEARRSERALRRLDLAGTELDAEGTRARELLAALREPLDVYDLTGPLGVPTFAFCAGTQTRAYAAGSTAARALTSGLRRILLAVQSAAYGEPGYAPTAVAQLPAGRLRSDLTAALPPPCTVVTVAERLRVSGRTAVAVPLDHDPALAAIMPYLVEVVVLDD